jgi:hypothetical protein
LARNRDGTGDAAGAIVKIAIAFRDPQGDEFDGR